MRIIKSTLALFVFLIGFSAIAQVKVSKLFSDHMVLQRNQENPVWGTAKSGEKITVSIDGQKHKIIADSKGNWKVKLSPMKAGGPFEMKVKGKNKIVIEDILVGEVWICTGQSNMQWSVINSNHSDIEIASANYPNIRLFSVPLVGSTEKQTELGGDTSWLACTPESIPEFSAAGYFFGRKLHQSLDVPVGLINASWGASSLETWIARDAMEATNEHTELLGDWDLAAAEFTDEKLAEVTRLYEEWEAAGKPGKKMRPARDIRIAQNRPANAFNGVINPVLGYGIKGAIWCQGESNLGRGYQYRSLFPLLINSWRSSWGQGDFPFYWVQLASMKNPDIEPTTSSWAELRESQTETLSLVNTGEVVTMDLGEGRDIHYRNKQPVGARLARLALSKNYGFEIANESPRYESMEIKGDKIIITFNHIDEGLYAANFPEINGFSISGEDQKFVWADAKIINKNTIEISSDKISKPIAVRYAWSNYPNANLFDRNGLPVTGFRTDTWKLSSQDRKKAFRRY